MKKIDVTSNIKPKKNNDLNILTSGAFAAPLFEILKSYKKNKSIKLYFGSSFGDAKNSVPTRLKQKQNFDIIFLSADAYNQFNKKKLIKYYTKIDIVDSEIGFVVKKKNKVKYNYNPFQFVQLVKKSKKIAIAASASGIYLKQNLFPKLKVKNYCIVKGKRIGSVISEDKTFDLGFQQYSELLPYKNKVSLLGTLPTQMKKRFVFSLAYLKENEKIKKIDQFISFLKSKRVSSIIKKKGLTPLI
ncbi:MAG: hypothetical protein EVA56_04070 [alpha proteobacterium HIMB114]|nr:MAG: hypothetical protein EVA56_04070 [alpha proteobacterium HIMB114]